MTAGWGGGGGGMILNVGSMCLYEYDDVCVVGRNFTC